MLKVIACVILCVLVVEGLDLSFFHKIQAEKSVIGRSIEKRGACPPISVKCGRVNAGCGVPTGTEPCTECITNATVCAISASNDTAKCACYTDGLACINSFTATYPGCAFYGYSMYQYFSEQYSLPCLGSAPVIDYTYCEIGASCNNGTCKLVSKSGSCTSSADCGDSSDPFAFAAGGMYQCSQGTCELAPGYASVGDPCKNNVDCNNYPDVTCNNGVCVGLAKDATCTGDGQCDLAFFCDTTTNKCTPRVANGADCPTLLWGKHEPCSVPDNICSVGKCIKAFSKQVGAACNSSDECATTLICDQNTNTCTNPYPDLACNDNTDCPNNGTYTGQCSCSGLSSKTQTCDKTQSPQAGGSTCFPTVVADLAACLDKNNCELSFVPGSCARSKCLNEMGCYYNCVIGQIVPTGCSSSPASCQSSSSGATAGDTTGKSAASSVAICMWLALVLIVFSMF